MSSNGDKTSNLLNSLQKLGYILGGDRGVDIQPDINTNYIIDELISFKEIVHERYGLKGDIRDKFMEKVGKTLKSMGYTNDTIKESIDDIDPSELNENNLNKTVSYIINNIYKDTDREPINPSKTITIDPFLYIKRRLIEIGIPLSYIEGYIKHSMIPGISSLQLESMVVDKYFTKDASSILAPVAASSILAPVAASSILAPVAASSMAPIGTSPTSNKPPPYSSANYTLIDVAGDGNCGYHAIIHGLVECERLNYIADINGNIIKYKLNDINELKRRILQELEIKMPPWVPCDLNTEPEKSFKNIQSKLTESNPNNRYYWIREGMKGGMDNPNMWLHDQDISYISNIYDVCIAVYARSDVQDVNQLDWFYYYPQNHDISNNHVIGCANVIYIINRYGAHFSYLIRNNVSN